jgi:hypothetical protein
MNGLRKCVYTQWQFTQQQRRMKFFHSQVNGWSWRTSSYTKLARLRRPEVTCSPSYADFRPKTNALILLEMGYMLRGEHVQEEMLREEAYRRNRER